jgi:Uma2 family endonuclease
MEDRVGQPRRHSVEEYFRIEADSTEKHDYIDGQIVSMAGGTATHSLIIANLIASVHGRLKGKPCRVYDSNLRVAVKRDVRYSYPDLSIVCDDPQFDPRDKNRTTITNPRAVIEVLSPATEAADRGEKFERYLKLPSLQEYILVLQTRPRIEAYFRQPDGTWLFSFAHGLDASLHLRSLSIDLPFADVYTGVEFPPEPSDDVKPDPQTG